MVDVCRLWRHRRSTLACRQSTVADKGDTDVRAIASLPNKATEPGPTHRRLRTQGGEYVFTCIHSARKYTYNTCIHVFTQPPTEL